MEYIDISAVFWQTFLRLLQFKESVAQFAQENIAPHAANIDNTNYFPKVVQNVFFFDM